MALVKPSSNLHEKLLSEGAKNLSDMELLAVFIGGGHAKKSCLQLATDLIEHFGDLRSLLNADPKLCKNLRGLGKIRYAQLQAIKEICKRSDFIYLKKEIQITNSHQTYVFLKKRMRDYKNETFAALFLDNQNRIITYEELFFGTIHSATVHPRPIIERALQLNAAALILAHNHPSGSAEASHQDLALTQRIFEALDLMDLRLLDHLIIGDNEVYSIMAESMTYCH